MHDRPGEQEVERRSATLRDHRMQHVSQRPAPDEERERFVLVRRPEPEQPAEHPRDNGGEHAGRRGEGIDLHRSGLQADTGASVFHSRAYL